MSSFASAHQDFSETLVNNVSHIGSRLGSGFVVSITINGNIEIYDLFIHGWSIDVCDSDPCYNGGTCHGESGMAKCECPAGYDGRFCELSKYTDG